MCEDCNTVCTETQKRVMYMHGQQVVGTTSRPLSSISASGGNDVLTQKDYIDLILWPHVEPLVQKVHFPLASR